LFFDDKNDSAEYKPENVLPENGNGSAENGKGSMTKTLDEYEKKAAESRITAGLDGVDRGRAQYLELPRLAPTRASTPRPGQPGWDKVVVVEGRVALEADGAWLQVVKFNDKSNGLYSERYRAIYDFPGNEVREGVLVGERQARFEDEPGQWRTYTFRDETKKIPVRLVALFGEEEGSFELRAVESKQLLPLADVEETPQWYQDSLRERKKVPGKLLSRAVAAMLFFMCTDAKDGEPERAHVDDYAMDLDGRSWLSAALNLLYPSPDVSWVKEWEAFDTQ